MGIYEQMLKVPASELVAAIKRLDEQSDKLSKDREELQKSMAMVFKERDLVFQLLAVADPRAYEALVKSYK